MAPILASVQLSTATRPWKANVLGKHAAARYLERTRIEGVHAGARGYLLKDVTLDTLTQAMIGPSG
jgi:DNA-binding NarL/FixJ family response regulator